jgi:hypothetical protein
MTVVLHRAIIAETDSLRTTDTHLVAEGASTPPGVRRWPRTARSPNSVQSSSAPPLCYPAARRATRPIGQDLARINRRVVSPSDTFFAIMFDTRSFLLNGRWYVSQGPVPLGPGRDDDPSGAASGPVEFPELGSPRWRLLPPGSDPMDDPEVREAYLAALAEDEDPGDPGEEEDPDSAPPPGLDDAGLAALIAGAREVAVDQVRAAAVAARLGETAAMAAVGAAVGRRGPGMPGSACSFPGEYTSPAAGFATGKPLDAAPGCAVLGPFAGDAAQRSVRGRRPDLPVQRESGVPT